MQASLEKSTGAFLLGDSMKEQLDRIEAKLDWLIDLLLEEEQEEEEKFSGDLSADELTPKIPDEL